MKQTEITSYIFLEKKYIFYILSNGSFWNKSRFRPRRNARPPGTFRCARASPPLRHFSVPAARRLYGTKISPFGESESPPITKRGSRNQRRCYERIRYARHAGDRLWQHPDTAGDRLHPRHVRQGCGRSRKKAEPFFTLLVRTQGCPRTQAGIDNRAVRLSRRAREQMPRRRRTYPTTPRKGYATACSCLPRGDVGRSGWFIPGALTEIRRRFPTRVIPLSAKASPVFAVRHRA